MFHFASVHRLHTILDQITYPKQQQRVSQKSLFRIQSAALAAFFLIFNQQGANFFCWQTDSYSQFSRHSAAILCPPSAFSICAPLRRARTHIIGCTYAQSLHNIFEMIAFFTGWTFFAHIRVTTNILSSFGALNSITPRIHKSCYPSEARLCTPYPIVKTSLGRVQKRMNGRIHFQHKNVHAYVLLIIVFGQNAIIMHVRASVGSSVWCAYVYKSRYELSHTGSKENTVGAGSCFVSIK